MGEAGGEVKTHYGACNLCEAICGLEFKVQDGRVLSIRGDEADPFSEGHICPKAVALKDIHEDPDRLRRPLRRDGETWSEIGWDEAFDLVVERLFAIREQHGANSIAAYLGNPSVHNVGVLTHSPMFLGPFKTRNRFSATSVDQLPHQLIAYWMFGHQLLLPIPDIDRTSYFLVLGANPMASNGSLMTVPNFRERLKRLQARGGRMVVIDPRRSETAEVADEHHFIRPGADAALLFAMLNTIVEEGLARPGRLAEFTDGFDAACAAVAAFTPERVAALTGMDAATIRRIARDFAQADGAACYGRIGLSIQPFGALCQWAIQLINIATGNLDRAGGTLFTRPAVDMIDSPNSRPGHFGAWRSRVGGQPEFGGELPVSVLAEEITTPGEGQVRALVTIAGNPVLSTPGGNTLDAALQTLDFMVAVDPYLNETTRRAHVILPPTCGLEHDNYDLVFHVFGVRNTTRFSPAIIAKPAGTMHDHEIFTALAERVHARMGLKPPPKILPEQIIDIGLQTGPYGAARKAPQALSLAKVRAAPHGIDLGALEPCLPARLQNKGKRIACAIPELIADVARAQAELLGPGKAANGTLALIGRRHIRSNNSWMHNYARLVKGKDRCLLMMHPLDAAHRGLTDGQSVRVRSRVGELNAPLHVTDEVMPGVVSLPHGWGHAREGMRLGVASEHAGVSVNDLTDPQRFDVVSGNAALNGVAVEVEAL